MAARTTTTRTKAQRKKAGAARRRVGVLEADLEDLPATLRDFSHRMGRGLTRLEKQIEGKGRDVRRRLTRLLREASHRLGRLEAEGERRWRVQSRRARRDAARLLRRLEKAIEPPRPRRRRKATPRSSGSEPAGGGI